MSYDLAVWEGERPSSDSEAADVYEQLLDRYHGDAPAAEPSPAMRAYVAALLARWPDIMVEGGEDSPWSDGPLINNAIGPIIYFGMIYSMAEEASTFAAYLAEQHDLVCFDPQTMNLRPVSSPQSNPGEGASDGFDAGGRGRRWWRRNP